MRRHAQTFRDSSSSYKINYVIVVKTFLNPINGSKVTAILLQGRILPIGGASAVEGLRSTGLPRLVLEQPWDFFFILHFKCMKYNVFL